MGICPNCKNSYDDTTVACPYCSSEISQSGTETKRENAPDTASLPIWVTQKSNLPADGSLDDFPDSFLGSLPDDLPDDSPDDLHDGSLNGFGSDDLSSPQKQHAYKPRSFHSHDNSSDNDAFDEIADFVSLLYSNMSPKLKRFLIITVIGSILSVIPLIYLACS